MEELELRPVALLYELKAQSEGMLSVITV